MWHRNQYKLVWSNIGWEESLLTILVGQERANICISKRMACSDIRTAELNQTVQT